MVGSRKRNSFTIPSPYRWQIIKETASSQKFIHPQRYGRCERHTMNDEQQLVIIYLKHHEGETVEDVLNALSADSLGHRLALANALEYLVWNGYIKKDLVTGALRLSEALK